MNLYEIDKEITELFDSMVDPETGEIDDALYSELEELKIERDTKVENIACFIKNLKADAVALREEAKTLTERARRAENKVKSLSRYLEYAVGGEKFVTTRCSITWRKTKAVQCDLEDFSNLPEQFLRYKNLELNKTEIKIFIEQGGTVEGCSIVERESMLLK